MRQSASALLLFSLLAACLGQARAQETLERSADMVLDSHALHLPASALYARFINGVAYQDAPLVTRNGYQYAVWYTYDGSTNEHAYIARRDLNSDTWQAFDTGRDLINGDDNWDGHNVISLGISRDGRLHVAYDMHGNTLKYFNSVPGVALTPESTQWDRNLFNANQDWLVAPGQTLTRVTYPEFTLAPDGDLVMTYRFDSSGSGDVMFTRYDTSSGTWSTPHQILNRSGTYTDKLGSSTTRNGYLNALDFGPDGKIHITWTWREDSAGGNHDILYAYSEDGGNTWKNNAGLSVGTVSAPIKVTSPGTVIAPMDRTNSLSNQQGQTVDLDGRVHVLVFHRRDEPGYEWQSADGEQYITKDSAHYHYFRDPDSRTWTRVRLPVTREVGSRPSIGYDRQGNVFAVYISPDAGDTGGSQTEGDLIVAKATKAAGYTDWHIVFTDDRKFISEPFIDQDRLVNDDVLSIFAQEYSLVTGTSGSPLHVMEFKVGGYDYGDAPDPGFPTLLASNGARHLLSALRLGNRIDAESDGQPQSGASGDDIAQSDDEDGVDFPVLLAGQPATVNLDVAGGAGRVDAWVDFNADGDWNDVGERIADGTAVVSGSNALVFPVPEGAAVGNTFARVRLSTQGVAGSTGPAADGEVEDEQVSIAQHTLSIADVQGNEGNTDTTGFDFAVTLNPASAGEVFVDYETATGSADAEDFESVSGTLTVPAGATSAVISVPVKGDAVFEPDEIFSLSLSNPIGATIIDDAASGTIVNDDESTDPGTLQIAAASYSVSESNATATIALTRTGGSYGPASVQIATSDGSASAGIDYGSVTQTVNWADGDEGTQSVVIPINGDALDEPDETVLVTLSDASGAPLGTITTSTLTIADDDPAPTVSFSASSKSVSESIGTVTVRVNLSSVSARAITVPLSFSGTGKQAGDYQPSASSLSIPAGSSGADLQLKVSNDALDEGTETVIVDLGSPVNAGKGSVARYTLSISDDDPTPTVKFTSSSKTVSESVGTVTVRVSLSAISGRTITVPFSFSGTAGRPADYSASTSSLSIPAGASGADLRLTVVNDKTREGQETAIVTMGTPTNAGKGSTTKYTLSISASD